MGVFHRGLFRGGIFLGESSGGKDFSCNQSPDMFTRSKSMIFFFTDHCIAVHRTDDETECTQAPYLCKGLGSHILFLYAYHILWQIICNCLLNIFRWTSHFTIPIFRIQIIVPISYFSYSFICNTNYSAWIYQLYETQCDIGRVKKEEVWRWQQTTTTVPLPPLPFWFIFFVKNRQ